MCIIAAFSSTAFTGLAALLVKHMEETYGADTAWTLNTYLCNFSIWITILLNSVWLVPQYFRRRKQVHKMLHQTTGGIGERVEEARGQPHTYKTLRVPASKRCMEHTVCGCYTHLRSPTARAWAQTEESRQAYDASTCNDEDGDNDC